MKFKGISDQGLNRIAKVVKAQGSEWLPNFLDEAEKDMVADIVRSTSAAIKWDIFLAAAVVVELLQDVNAHDEARAANDMLLGMLSVPIEDNREEE